MMAALDNYHAGTLKWQRSVRKLKRILCHLDGAEEVIIGYVRNLGVSSRDAETDLYQIEDPGWEPFTITGDDILEIANP